jgi:hypothetical protein
MGALSCELPRGANRFMIRENGTDIAGQSVSDMECE